MDKLLTTEQADADHEDKKGKAEAVNLIIYL